MPSKVNKVTGIMLAAANMAADQVYHDIHERRCWPYKAESPEYGLDIDRIYKEAQDANKLALLKDLIALAATLFAFISLPIAFAALVVIQFLFRQGMRERVKSALLSVTDESVATPGAAAERGNVLVSGGYAPFLGCGRSVRAWSFTVDLRKPADEARDVDAVTARELYAETQAAIESLELTEVQFRDVLCVDGRDVGELSLLMPGGRKDARPLSRVPSMVIDRFVGSNDSRTRHYKQLEIDLWGGQMVISMFYRYMIHSSLLYAEVRVHVLTPLKKEFLDYERLPFEHDLMKEIGRCVVAAPFLWLAAFRRLQRLLAGVGTLIDPPEQTNRKAIDADRKFNYGWERSLREQWAGAAYERYFQESDMDFYEKSIKDAFLESLLGSFRSRNISTAAFEQASSIIYNEGIIVSGGTVQADSMAAGKGAQAGVQKAIHVARAAAASTS